MKTIAILSMLHESESINSATRRFRNDPVIQWTLRRLFQAKLLDSIVIAAWDDQALGLDAVAGPIQFYRCGSRRIIPQLQAITTAQKWADGWRGGLLATCAFDRGYVGEIVQSISTEREADAAVLVDPAAGLVDPEIIDEMIATASAGQRDFYFTQAPPGLAGLLLKREMIDRLVTARAHPGRVVHYLPDAPVLDPVTSDACIALPLEVSRSVGRFLMDSSRQIKRISQFTEPLNGTLFSTQASGIAQRLKSYESIDELPRELVIELTSQRHSKPIFNPITYHPVQRSELSLTQVDKIVAQLAGQDDLRITLAGLGDPLLHSALADVLARFSSVASLSIETDLLEVDDSAIELLLRSKIDVISIHMPAITAPTYQKMMGVDRLKDVLENLRRLMLARQKLGLSTPIIVPTFVKTKINLDEMEQWYDTWLGAVQSAVITGPSTYAGQIPDCAVAEMSPPNRIPCRRINSRMMILSDGRMVHCEQDILGNSSIGTIESISLQEAWGHGIKSLRSSHQTGISLPVICQGCKEWYRP